jgi:hypothetical protein
LLRLQDFILIIILLLSFWWLLCRRRVTGVANSGSTVSTAIFRQTVFSAVQNASPEQTAVPTKVTKFP